MDRETVFNLNFHQFLISFDLEIISLIPEFDFGDERRARDFLAVVPQGRLAGSGPCMGILGLWARVCALASAASPRTGTLAAGSYGRGDTSRVGQVFCCQGIAIRPLFSVLAIQGQSPFRVLSIPRNWGPVSPLSTSISLFLSVLGVPQNKLGLVFSAGKDRHHEALLCFPRTWVPAVLNIYIYIYILVSWKPSGTLPHRATSLRIKRNLKRLAGKILSLLRIYQIKIIIPLAEYLRIP